MAAQQTDSLGEHVTLDPNGKKLTMGDFRPHLGALNWKLRVAGVAICVIAENLPNVPSADWVVTQIYLGPVAEWTMTCDGCGHEYKIKSEPAKCPKCGFEEERD